MPKFQDLPNLEGESILTHIFKSSLGIQLRVLKCFFFVFGAFSPAQMRRTRKISCQKHLSWASLITQMWLHWKELLHKVGLHWLSRQQLMILRGTEHLGEKPRNFYFFLSIWRFARHPPQGPPVLYFSQNVLLLQFKTESTRTLSNFDFQWTKILYQSNLKHIAFFLTFFKG